ncbi:MAG: hypothetical protein B0W54_19355 [Cellvibrio sp. 79]|nr:MAG: hypothetical protein B0W54_19355 [Cellvibrio sp. 79]
MNTKAITIRNERKTNLRVIIEPLADEIVLEAGASARFIVEVTNDSSEFEIGVAEAEAVVYLPSGFSEINVSINGQKYIEL